MLDIFNSRRTSGAVLVHGHSYAAVEPGSAIESVQEVTLTPRRLARHHIVTSPALDSAKRLFAWVDD